MEEKCKKLWSKIATGSLGAFFTLLLGELLEECIEDAIAWSFTKITFWLISSVTVVVLTQTTKMAIKKVIKMLTYREGDDKMDKLKKILSFLNANKCTIGGIATGALTVATGVGGIDVKNLPPIDIAGVNVTPFVYYTLLGVLTFACSFMPESVKRYKERVAQEKKVKQIEADELKAKKEVAEAEKQAKEEIKLAEKRIAEEKKQAEEAEKAQKKAQEEAEKNARIERIKEELIKKAQEKAGQ